MAPETLIFVILTCLIFYFTFRKAEAGLYLLVVAIPLSFWELPLNFLPYVMKSWYGGPVKSSLTINLADMVILAILLKTITRIKIEEARKLLRLPLSIAFILVLFTFSLSIAIAACRNLLSGDFLKTSIMYLAKFSEVVLVYFIVLFNLKTLRQIKRLTVMFILVGVLSVIATNAFPWMKWIGKGFFDTRLIPGGFYCILGGISFSLMLNEKAKPYFRILMEILVIIFAGAVIVSLKRSTYVGLLTMIAAMFFLRAEKRTVLTLLLFVSLAMFLSGEVKDRIVETWNFYEVRASNIEKAEPAITDARLKEMTIKAREDTSLTIKDTIEKINSVTTEDKKKLLDLVDSATVGSGREKKVFMGNLAPSLLVRFYTSIIALVYFIRYPICGIGFWGSLGHRYLTHNAYLQVLSETGLLGFAALLFLLIAIIKGGISAYTQKEDRFISDFSCGFLAGFAGIMAMGVFSEIFIVFTLMQIVYFMAGMLVISGVLLKEKDEKYYR